MGLKKLGIWSYFMDWGKFFGFLFIDEEVVLVFFCGFWDLMIFYFLKM